MVDELIELRTRLHKLEAYLNTDPIITVETYELLTKQNKAMKTYRDILYQRIMT